MNTNRIQNLLVAALIALANLSTVRAEEKKVTIPAGASLLVKLDTAVSSSDKPGTKFSGVLQGDLTGDGAAIGAGASALKKGESAGNAAGALVEFKLAAPLTITVKP